MIPFRNVVRITKPDGTVVKIKRNGVALWNWPTYHYVSLGDSIAAGHAINEDWTTGSQYEQNGNTTTAIVPGSYTDLIRSELMKMYGEKRTSAASFARSGDTTSDLIEKLSHGPVRNSIKKASLVTVCIGANDVLEPAMSNLEEYIYTGDLNTITATVNANLAALNNDSHASSYVALFNKLSEINPGAKYVFTSIYNPYKYLHIEEGQNGFFAPVLNTIPQMTILGIEVDSIIKEQLLNQDIVKTLFDRVNRLGAQSETYVTQLNAVLRGKINAYGNANFALADAKAAYDPVPDRPVSASKHYNDLVNVEYTRGYDTMAMDWGRLYEDSGGAANYWTALATKHVSLNGINMSGLASDLVADIVEKVIMPDVDPHPEQYGHYVLMRSFADALGWQSLDRHTITYHANGGSGTMAAQTFVSVDGLPAFANIATNAFSGATGYYFTSWNTKADGSGTAYTNGQLVGLSSDLTLYAQWSNIYTVTVRHSYDSVFHGSGDTGPMECYALWIDGTEQADLGAFSNGARTYRLAYGSQVGVIVMTKSGAARSYITLNGAKVAGNSSDARYTFTVTGDMVIHYEWCYWLDGLSPQSYWVCYVTK